MAEQRKDGNNFRAGILAGPRVLGTLLPGITRATFRKRAPATAQLLADWPALVGPALARTTRAQRLSGTTLTIGCEGAMALELQHIAPQLIARINTALGRVVVERLRFTQSVPAESPVQLPRRTPNPAAAAQAVEGLKPGPLRDALESLGTQVLGRD